MKTSELRQIIREELSKVTKNKKPKLQEENNIGLITFDQLKQAVKKLYFEHLEGAGYDPNEDEEGSYFITATDMGKLIDTLDELGFNGIDAYYFIFDAILK